MKVLFIVAHPDDAEYAAGGTLRHYTLGGHDVRVISVTNGSAGHQTLRGPQLVERRNRESWAASRIGEFKYQILNRHDAQLEPSNALRDELIGHIRTFDPAVIFTHRPYDYHPDHRTVGLMVQDASYLLTVPAVLPRAPAIPRAPIILFFEDSFTKPLPFEADVAVSIEATIEDKIAMLDCHVSQFYEWLPYNQQRLSEVPGGPEARREWLGGQVKRRAEATAAAHRSMLKSLYGSKAGKQVKFAEVFEVCEYGRAMSAELRDEIFPFLKS